ncbi:MAG: GIY-YIG nuclease family protein, partial [Bacteroidota bacterium]|nr:GIY-YIG nuclease family protein [Bacteroidota bacterium]MDX5430560.1 GIY-YIG nuclease family protein [Bacteroidota bacterium]MDX5469312.1 GIY-YIG nuclease family protein [Bacteroidota bacterium]
IRYAIVDIETTGGYAADNQMIEIAVAIHDGVQVIERYETLLNPGRKIPPYIAGFTGISDEMVAGAPEFREIAIDLFRLLEGKVFVAHNVNFDYSFVQKAFSDVGIHYQAKRLCTVRLSRKIIPGFKSYSLGNLCQQLGIDLTNAHRAGGDCEATAILFSLLVRKDSEGHIRQSLKSNNGELNLPPNLPKKQFDKLPISPGVYYFYDQNGKIIYIGKAKNIKKRVASHFGGKNESERKQQFLRDIHSVSCELTGNELIALLLEAQEIKKHWPKYNRAMKRVDFRFGLYDFEDRNGILNLVIDKSRKYFRPLVSFSSMYEAREFMLQMIRSYSLDRMYCGFEKLEWIEGKVVQKKRLESAPEIKSYNKRVQQAIEDLQYNRESFALIGHGRQHDEQSVVLVDDGVYRGFGFVNKDLSIQSREELEDLIQPVADFSESYWLIRRYMQRNVADKIIRFN